MKVCTRFTLCGVLLGQVEPHDDVSEWEQLPRYWPFSAGNSPVIGEFPAQMPVTRSFDVFFDLRLNKRLSKQSWGWWFETPSRLLWRHCNGYPVLRHWHWGNRTYDYTVPGKPTLNNVGIHQRPVNSPHKGPVTRKMLRFDYVIMPYPHLELSCCQICAGSVVFLFG